MFSFPDSVSPQRTQNWFEYGTVERVDENGNVRINPTLTVHYLFGQYMGDFPLMKGMSEVRFDGYVARLQEFVDQGIIDIPTMRIFVNNHTRLSYQMMLDGLTDFDPVEYRIRYPALPYLGYVYMLKPVSQRLINELLRLYELLEIDEEDWAANDEDMGVMQMGGSPAWFRIPLTYELDGNTILTIIDTEQITHEEGFALEQININRTFGATQTRDYGYLFIPDGSGSIIRNNEPQRGMNRVQMPFFGPDFGKNIMSAADMPINSVFPVFGARRGNVGMFSIVENGASLGGVIAEVTTGNIPYNRVFPYVLFHDFDAVHIVGTNLARMFAQESYNTEFTVRVNFLYDDWVDYSGWARFYQKYLVNTGVLTRNAGEAPVPLDINLIGSISKPVNTFGIPWLREYGVTTFQQAETITGILRDGGVNNANVIYSGAINGGLNFRSPNRVQFQSELGGARGFDQLYSNLTANGFGLFTEVDFMQAWQPGNGISLSVARHDVSRYVSGLTAFLAEYSPASLYQMWWYNRSSIMNPLIFASVGANFIRDYQRQVEHRSVYLASIGNMLASNFNEDMEVNREETILLTRDLLTQVQDAGFEIMLDSGNAYVLEFADRLINIPTTSSGQRIESYSIPFVAMVLSGYIPFTGESINRSGNMHRSLLEAVESGAGLHYTLIYANQLVFVDTFYTGMFSVNYDIWIEDIIRIYNRLNDEMGHLTNARIVNHERLGVRGTPEHQIVRVTYETGCIVYVNYGRVDFVTDSGRTVPQLDYLVIRG